MEDGSGTTVTDRVASGAQNGTITGATWTNGVLGKCLAFNGTSQYVTFGTTFRPASSQAWSVSCWIFDTAVDSTFRKIFCNQTTTTNAGIMLQVSSANKLNMQFGDTAGNLRAALSAATITANVWHHAVATWDGSATGTVYLDGVGHSNDTVTGTVGVVTYANNTTLGRYDPAAVQYWSGDIDDFKCYYHAMTSGEVNYLFRCGRQQPTNN
jgi:hypothetical protein